MGNGSSKSSYLKPTEEAEDREAAEEADETGGEAEAAASSSRSDPTDVWTSYRKDVSHYPTVPWEIQKQWLADYRKTKDPQAFDNLVTANLRLVIKEAVAYQKSHPNLSKLDLIQEGNLGLMKAIERFSPEKGVQLSTYAVPWIRVGMQRFAVNQSHYPEHLIKQRGAILKAERDLTQSLSRTPTDEEIVKAMGGKASKDVVSRVRQGLPEPLSLDTPVDYEDGTSSGSISDVVPDESQDPKAFAEDQVDLEKAKAALTQLPDRERTVLMMRLGLNSQSRSYTLPEIGRVYGISKQRAQQMVDGAIRKLRQLLNAGD